MSEIADQMASSSESTAPETPTETPTPTPEAPTTPSKWGELSPDQAAFLEKKGWTESDPIAVLNSYIELQKHMGAGPENLIKIPTDGDPEQMAEMYKKLGRPEDASGYGIELEDAGAKEFYEQAALKLNLNPQQAKEMVEIGEQRMASIKEAETEAFKNQVEDAKKNLQNEWGRDFDVNVKFAIEAEERFGVSLDDASALMGPQKAMELMAKLGRAELGNNYVSSDNKPSGNTGMSPELAKAELDKKMADPNFRKRLFSGENSVRQAAVAEQQKLLKIIKGYDT